MFTSLFWKDFFERWLSTVAQVAAGLLASDAAFSVDYKVWLLTLGTASLGVLAKCLAANQVSGTISPGSFAQAAPDLPAVDVEEVKSTRAKKKVVD